MTLPIAPSGLGPATAAAPAATLAFGTGARVEIHLVELLPSGEARVQLRAAGAPAGSAWSPPVAVRLEAALAAQLAARPAPTMSNPAASNPAASNPATSNPAIPASTVTTGTGGPPTLQVQIAALHPALVLRALPDGGASAGTLPTAALVAQGARPTGSPAGSPAPLLSAQAPLGSPPGSAPAAPPVNPTGTVGSAPLSPLPTDPAAREAWITAQLRQHLPHAQPLAPTLQRWLNALPGGAALAQTATPGSSPTLPLTTLPTPHQATLPPLPLGTAPPPPPVAVQSGQTTLAVTPGAPTLAAGSGVLTADSGGARTDARPLDASLRDLLNALPTAAAVTDPARLATALRRSGLWLESTLASNPVGPALTSDLNGDLKTLLLRLAGQLRAVNALPPARGRVAGAGTPSASADPAPAAHRQLAREVDGLLKQVVTRQLQALDSTLDQQRWLLELPVKTGLGVLALEAELRRERNSMGEDGEPHWSMQLRLDLPRLGPVLLTLALRAGQVNATLVAEQPEGARLLREHLPVLHGQLNERGLSVGRLNAGQGGCVLDPGAGRRLLRELA